MVRDFLLVDSPEEWFQAAPEHLSELLMDHANCEKKGSQHRAEHDVSLCPVP
jgi:tRNA isopentenyl-2-thiomethyl-A-37 hydroxylase MiaE